MIGMGAWGTVQYIAWQDHMGGYFAGLLLVGPFDRFVGLSAKLSRRGRLNGRVRDIGIGRGAATPAPGGTKMSDTNSAGSVPPPPQAAVPHHPPFPFVRLLFAIGYGFVAWFVMHVIFVLAAAQFVVIAVNGRANDELKAFCTTLIQYEWELLAYITFVRDEQPFPIGPFPKHA